MNNLFKKAQEGFTLLEITVAMGMLGVLTTVIIGLNKQQVELEKRAETSSEIASFHRRILGEFVSKESCEATLGGIGDPGDPTASPVVPATPAAVLTDPMAIQSIRKDDGNVLYSVDYEFGRDVSSSEKYYKIDSMTVDFDLSASGIKADPAGSDANDTLVSANLIIVYKIADGVANIIGSRQKPKTIALGDIQVTDTGGTHTLRGCVGNGPTAPAAAATLGITARDACDISTGILDTSITEINKCRLSHFFDYSILPRGGTQEICSRDPADASYCVTAWGMSSNTLERHAISADSMTSYLNRTYGLGSSPPANVDTENLFLGRESESTGINNTLIGHQAGNEVDPTANSADKNTFLGYRAGKSTTTGGSNTLVGDLSGDDNTTGANNVFIGQGAGNGNTTGKDNIYIGKDASATPGQSNTGDEQLNIGNLLIGELPANTTGAPNTSELSSNDGLIVNGALVVRRNTKIKEQLEVQQSLIVTQYIKVGTTTLTCNSANKGIIRYNTGTNVMEYCNESQWTAMSGASGGGTSDAQYPVLLR